MNLLRIFIFIYSVITISGQGIGKWKNYTNMNELNKLSVTDNGIWGATNGGGFLKAIDDETFLTLTKSEGLSNQTLTAVGTDNNGLIWFGTQDGIINIYNPTDETITKILDINKTLNSKKAINEIYISGDTAFVSIQFGLSLIDVNSFEFIETIEKFGGIPSKSSINSVYVSNLIYVSTENGVAILKPGASNLSNPESWETYINNSDFLAGDVSKSIEFNNQLIIGTDRGLYEFDRSNKSWVNFLSYNEPVFDLLVSGNSLYILFSNMLVEHDSNNDEIILQSTEISYFDLDLSSDGNFIIATDNGLLNFNGQEEEYSSPNSPVTNSFLSMAIDNDNTLWVGTGKDNRGAGVLKFDGTNWDVINKETSEEITSNDYHKVYSTPDNVKYFMNWGRGFTNLINDELKTFNASNSNLSGVTNSPTFVVIKDIKVDSHNNTWVFNHVSADNKPIIAITPDDEWIHYEIPILTLDQDVFINDALIDQYNTKWFSVNFRGLYYFNENGTLDNTSDDIWGWLTKSGYFNGQEVTSLAHDKRGEIWVGTTFGIYIIPNPNSPQSSTLPVFGLRQQSVNCIAVDPINQKWVGTSQGVFVMSPDGTAIINLYDSKNSPLPTDIIRSITIDEKTGIVYIGTEFGLSTLATEYIKPEKSFDNLFVYPNPFIISGNSNEQLTIDGLIEDSFIKILSISGSLVTEYSSPGGRIAFWDGRDNNGNLVPSGIYLIITFDEEANSVATSKVAVIRK